MAINSKNKGNSYERKISILFSKRFAEKTGISNSFRRNVDSGAFFGSSNQKRMETHNIESANFGDIICPSNFKYSLECKAYKVPPSFDNILKQNYKEWDEWIKQAEQDSKNANKIMAIIVKYNRVEEFAILDRELENVYNLRYKKYFIVSLKDFLSKHDDFYFD